jgi:hypothetical protein
MIRRNLTDDGNSNGRGGKSVDSTSRIGIQSNSAGDSDKCEEPAAATAAAVDFGFIDKFEIMNDSICYSSAGRATAVAHYVDHCRGNSSSANEGMDESYQGEIAGCDGDEGRNMLLNMSIPFDLFIGKVKDANENDSEDLLTDAEKVLAERVFYSLLGISTAAAGTDSSALHQAFLTYVDTNTRFLKSQALALEACAGRVAALLRTRPVATVLEFLKLLISKAMEYANSENAFQSSGRVRKGSHSKKKQRRQRSIAKNKFEKEFQPCHHTGPCSKSNCPCARGGTYCEKYCACDSKVCGLQFNGNLDSYALVNYFFFSSCNNIVS